MNASTITAKIVKAASAGLDVDFADGTAAIVEFFNGGGHSRRGQYYSVSLYSADDQFQGVRYFRTWDEAKAALVREAERATERAENVTPTTKSRGLVKRTLFGAPLKQYAVAEYTAPASAEACLAGRTVRIAGVLYEQRIITEWAEFATEAEALAAFTGRT